VIVAHRFNRGVSERLPKHNEAPPINLLLWGRYLAFKQDNQYLKQKTKKGGGQFDPELGGHFGPEYPGHFKSESGGQFERNLHSRPTPDF
jgi:hypothetical protein